MPTKRSIPAAARPLPTAVLDCFHPSVQAWFQSSFDAPTRAQALAWPEILAGRSTLLSAPTGSGKTLAAFLAAIERLAASGRVLYGEFRPGGRGREWCDAEVLAALRRRSLARLRRQVEPAAPAALARLLTNWQGVVPEGGQRPATGGPDALLDVLERALRDGSTDEPAAVVLGAADPANPYGATLPWPKEEARLARVPGAHVVLVDGLLAAYLSREERDLRAFLPEAEPVRRAAGRAAARGLAAWMRHTGRQGLGWDAEAEVPASRGALAPFLTEAGFQPFGSVLRLGSFAERMGL